MKKYNSKKRCDEFMENVYKMAVQQFIRELPKDEYRDVQAELRKHLSVLGNNIISVFVAAEEKMNKVRMDFRMGEAVVILNHDDSPKKSQEWRKKNGTYQLKLWEKISIPRLWYGGTGETRRAIKGRDGKVISWPPGTIGYIDLDYNIKSMTKTQNIRVKIDGYVGWTDYRNLKIYQHPVDDEDDASIDASILAGKIADSVVSVKVKPKKLKRK